MARRWSCTLKGVFWRLARREAGVQTADFVIGIAGVKEGDRVALALRGIDHPVQGRAISVIGPTRDHIAEVDHESTG